ncbi:uncharacterized protein GGS22DRAFT_179033 [Annulohypoxylon maeteangense]|uniref:uncharacterized protein n=1 Tax=Annulohypoxylon maeteangense TaxID=1927788 RepID=UPI002007C6CB|nr:uncharacterized protein GGS22DRAFT_179033 [Annulohypoxylon maeteangense]KAI0885990.1 hypothetical protein GGS22DRAFT_179033 [Annulohypoxylon maeteangense]
MASQASVASSQPDPRQLRLIAASAQANEARVRDILAEDPPWTSSTDHDALRQSLQKAAARGKLSIVLLLLDHGAELNPRKDNEIPALVKAAEGGQAEIVAELLKRGADPNGRNRNGQTALFSACLKGYNKVVEKLLNGKANVEAQDKEGRSPLLFLASEKPGKGKWTLETLKLLLSNGANLEVKDQIGRTPLLWAATNGNVELARVLLENYARLDVTNNRGRTALHLAAEGSHKEQSEEMVRLLLDHEADPSAVSDGGWTPLHNAAQSGYAPIVALLLETGANVNAVLSNGMTPLHWAAFNGCEEVVQLILTRFDVNLSIKDSFNRTAMLCAAEKNHPEIVQLLSPARGADRLSPVAQQACRAFEATVVDFGQFEKKQLVSKYSVYELLYGWDHENEKPKVPTLTKNIKYQPDFRWIHLPANNIAWVETLLAKSFIEAGHRDIEAFKALEKCFDQEHQGQHAHAHFMRTFSNRITSPRAGLQDKRDDKSSLAPLSEEPSDVSMGSTQNSTNDGDSPKKSSDHFEDDMPTKKKSKSEMIAERHPKKHKRAKGPPGNPPQRQDSFASNLSGKFQAPLAWETPKFAASSGKIVLFMPFLHYETDERRRKMSKAIKNVYEDRQVLDNSSRDSLIVNAYLKSEPRLHPRRTLDQFFYHGIDTSARDTDQVVYRYCKRHNKEPKVFMVDQLWLWIIGKDLVITCFPQRWDQPKQDPLNVLDGIIEETNAKTRPPIGSVCRCSGTFDRHRLDNQDFQFLDMFESSIGLVTDRESQLFSRFNKASAQSAQWLQHHRRRRSMGRPARLPSFGSPNEYHGKDMDQFPDALLDIGVETSLLAEIKDIRDELGIITGLLEGQLSTLDDFEMQITDELRSNSGTGENRRAIDLAVTDIRKRSREQLRGLEIRKKDIERMDHQAESLYRNLTDLLDLKQKHSNALEARFAGDQAVIAARQGQTVMVFTIVTIIFLPMSFIAAFFAINLQEWEGGKLTIPYVSKYLFGIGLGVSVPLIATAFTITDISDTVRGFTDRCFGARGRGRRRKERGGGGGVEEETVVIQPKTSLSSHRLGREQLLDGASSRVLPTRHSRERSTDYYAAARLSPTSFGQRIAGGPRKVSFSSANAAGSWARPSLDRSRRGRLSEDLEKGRRNYA